MAAEITTTAKTPIATPSMVSAARTLFARNESSAMTTPSVTVDRPRRPIAMKLFLPEGRDGIQTRRAARRIHTGDDPDTSANRYADNDRPQLNGCRQRRYRLNDLRESRAAGDAQRRADDGERDRLHQELAEDIAPARA